MRKKLGIFTFLIWIIPITFVLSLMVGLHNAAVKKHPLQGLGTTHSMVVHHFLSLKCQCSKKVLAHLIKRHALPNTTELVHLIDSKPEMLSQLEAVGYQTNSIDEEEAVRRFNLHALPQLVITHAQQTLYQGGYGPDQQHTEIYGDEKIIKELESQLLAGTSKGNVIVEFPIFGCANGTLQKKALDFLGLKYGKTKETF
jgi:hypothetical protein